MFDIDQFVADCIEARAEAEPRRAVRELLDQTMSDPGPVADALIRLFPPTEAPPTTP